MTNKQKLEALIQKAIDNGFPNKDGFTIDNFGRVYAWFPSLEDKTNWYRPESIVFNHEFAKALFGEGLVDKEDIDHVTAGMSNFEYHLQQAVINEDPISYMYETVFND